MKTLPQPIILADHRINRASPCHETYLLLREIHRIVETRIKSLRPFQIARTETDGHAIRQGHVSARPDQNILFRTGLLSTVI